MKRKKAQSEGGSGEQGIRVLTVALFIILLAFFIVLNSIAVIDESRTLAAWGSLLGSFGILPGGLSPTKQEEARGPSSQVPIIAHSTGTIQELSLGEPIPETVAIRSIPKGEVISIQEEALFDKGGYKIKPAGYAFLIRLCEIINQGQYPVEITGHTDSRPPDEKSVRSNWELSSLRALEVLKFLVVIGNVLPSRMMAYGCAEHRPVASNEARQTRARNRRVDVALHHGSSEKVNKVHKERQSGFVVFKRFVFRIFD